MVRRRNVYSEFSLFYSCLFFLNQTISIKLFFCRLLNLWTSDVRLRLIHWSHIILYYYYEKFSYATSSRCIPAISSVQALFLRSLYKKKCNKSDESIQVTCHAYSIKFIVLYSIYHFVSPQVPAGIPTVLAHFSRYLWPVRPYGVTVFHLLTFSFFLPSR